MEPTNIGFIDKIVRFMEDSFINRYISQWLIQNGFDIPAQFLTAAVFMVSAIIIASLLKLLWALALLKLLGGVKGTGATGRLAYFMEIFKNFTIPTRFSTICHTIGIICGVFVFLLGAFSIIVSVGFLEGFAISASMIKGIIIISIISGIAIKLLFTKSLKQKVSDSIPYLLGKQGIMNVSLTGGIRKSLIRGNVSDQRQEHILLVGPTGSGKTSSYFIPQILDDAFSNCSAVIIEAKPETQESMFDIIAPVWIKAGRKVMLFDPWRKDGASNHFNPLLFLKPDFEDEMSQNFARDIVNTLYSVEWAEQRRRPGQDIHFVKQERNLLTPLLILLQQRKREERNFAFMRDNIVGGTTDDCRRFVLQTLPSNNQNLIKQAKSDLNWFIDEQNLRKDRKAEMLTSLRGLIDVFGTKTIRKFTVNNDIDLEMVFKEPCLICIRSPFNYPGGGTIPSIIMKMIMSMSSSKSLYNTDKNFKVNFYVDEMPSLAIPDIDRFTKTARSAGVGLVASVQEKADLLVVSDPRMGQLGIEALIANFATKILMPNITKDTAEYFTKASGLTTVNTQRGQRKTFNIISSQYIKNSEDIPVITADEMIYRDLNSDKNYVYIFSRIRPFKISMVPWYKTRKYKKLVDSCAKIKKTLYRMPTEYMPTERILLGSSFEKIVSKDRDKVQNISLLDIPENPKFEPEDAGLDRKSHDIPPLLKDTTAEKDTDDLLTDTDY